MKIAVYAFSVALLVYFLILLVMGGIGLKEFLWIAFFYIVFVTVFMVLHDLEKDLVFLLKLMDKRLTDDEKSDVHSGNVCETDRKE